MKESVIFMEEIFYASAWNVFSLLALFVHLSEFLLHKCFILTPAKWVAKVKVFMINSFTKHTGEKGEKILVDISVFNAVTLIQCNYFLPMALN